MVVLGLLRIGRAERVGRLGHDIHAGQQPRRPTLRDRGQADEDDVCHYELSRIDVSPARRGRSERAAVSTEFSTPGICAVSPPATPDPTQLRHQINAETAKIAWRELQRFFAAGTVLYVAPDLDLVEVALTLARDDSERFSDLTNRGKVQKVSDAQAKEWVEANALMWCVVIKPWILAQPILAPPSPAPQS